MRGMGKPAGWPDGYQNWLESCIWAALLLACSFIFLLNSPLNIWSGADAATDSSVFKTVAFMMDKGYMPYRDSFDHKGPLVYLLNLSGMKIAAYRGVWVLEFLTVSVTFFMIFRIARLCCKNIYAFISLLVSVSLLWKYFEGGNLVEEYAMPFIAISLYIYLDYLIHNKIHAVRLCVCGLSFGAVCLLRPNMVSVWIVFSLAVCVRLVLTGDISRIWYFLVWFVAGFCVIVLPVVFWLAASHSLHAFVECYFHFNFVYSSAEGGGATAGAKWNSFFTFLNSMPVLLSTASCCVLFKRKDRFLYGIYLIYLVCTLVFICISGHTFGHYGMILVPAVAFPIASFLDDCVLRAEGKGLPVCLVMYFLVSVALPDWMSAAGRVISTYENRGEEHRSGLVLEVCRIVGEHTEKDDKISVYGNWDIIYILSNRMHATRYSYQIPVGNIMPELMDDYFRQLGEEQPPVILTAPGFMDERLNSFVQQYHYKEIWSESGTIIYLNESAVRGTG